MPTKSKAWYGNTIKAHCAPTKIICVDRNPVAGMEAAHGGFQCDRNVEQEVTERVLNKEIDKISRKGGIRHAV